jgi:hypothetical protein
LAFGATERGRHEGAEIELSARGRAKSALSESLLTVGDVAPEGTGVEDEIEYSQVRQMRAAVLFSWVVLMLYRSLAS